MTEPETQKILMPTPEWLGMGPDTAGMNDGEEHPYLGIQAKSLDGTVKDFYLWVNYESSSLNDLEAREEAASLISRIKLQHETEVSIGPAIKDFNIKKKTFEIERERGYGIYVEAGLRPGFNFRANVDGIKSKEYWQNAAPDEFEDIFKKSMEILPYDS